MDNHGKKIVAKAEEMRALVGHSYFDNFPGMLLDDSVREQEERKKQIAQTKAIVRASNNRRVNRGYCAQLDITKRLRVFIWGAPEGFQVPETLN